MFNIALQFIVSIVIGNDDEEIVDYNRQKCTYGYRFFLVSCIDINECTENSHNCNPGEICFNYDGGYRCDQVSYD